MESLQLQSLQETKPHCYYNEIKQIIIEICDFHNKFSATWIDKNKSSDLEFLNLNKKQVREVTDIYEEREVFFPKDEFNRLLKNYMNELKPLAIDFEMAYNYEHFDMRSRGKDFDSIMNKLQYYTTGKEGNGVAGAFKINKCLNDLFGIRIVIENFDHNCEYFYQICEPVKDKYKIRIINSSKNDYRATHVYFYGGNNKFFPWELQIWNADDCKSNDISHGVHKRSYTEWAKIYKNTKEIEGGA
ncbi:MULTISPECIES: hypothetical protein [Bacillus]|uniref:hypothetical protein n=1 Tax=Bacillus TaxID=1386 RepID=UPI0011EC5DE3|nr:hypothetical protein [Bacillus sp. BPN334]KAA0791738.1 hypothetical protein DN393_07905 [Bacillus sp. BPN334]